MITAYETWRDGDTVGIRNSLGNVLVSSDPDVLLGFLENTGYNSLHVFWNLDESISSILRKLPLDTIKSLAKHEPKLSFKGHHLYYLLDKSATIGNTRYYGIRSFWSTSEPEPTTLEELQEKAVTLIDTLAQLGMPDPVGLVSPIYVFERSELGRKTFESLPPARDLPEFWDESMEYANQADRKDWVTAYRLGKFDGLFDYDQNSCYGAIASKLIDLRDCEIWKSDKLGKREMGAFYGFVKGRFYINPDTSYLSPIVVPKDKNHPPTNMAGWLPEDIYELRELRTVERYGLGTFEMVDGWFIMPRSGVRTSTPFMSIMSTLYDKRYWSPLAKTVAKGIANQLIGKLIEIKENDEYSPIYNGIYHAIITAHGRCEITDFLVENGVAETELVVVQTDGCRIKKEISVHSNGMGSWRCNGAVDTIVASHKRVWAGSLKPNSLQYSDIVQMISEHPMSRSYYRTLTRRTTLAQAVSQGDPSSVGEQHSVVAHLDLVAMDRGQNRYFKKLPKTGKSLLSNEYGSEPIVMEATR